jgi:hypothetical protein
MAEGVISVDPGGTSGIAFELDSGQRATCALTDPNEVWSLAARDAFDVIVVERFTTSGVLSKYGLQTIEIVGGLRAIAHLYNKRLVLHYPQQRLAYMADAKQLLRDLKVPYVIHEVDATAHMLAYLETGK